METTLLSSSIFPPLSFSPRISRDQNLKYVPIKRSTNGKVFARRKESCDWDYSGRLVDQSMIILRKRIHEMKVMERNYEPPEDWMQWEKQYYASYDELICKLVGLLQTQLINARPSLALGILMLITMSVPASTAMILSQFIELANTLLLAVHHG